MSNAKWVKVLLAVARSPVRPLRVRWTTWNSSEENEFSFWDEWPRDFDVEPQRFADGRFALLDYRWIIEAFIPHEFATVAAVGHRTRQDTTQIRALIESLGEVPVEETADGIAIRAYD